MLLSENFDDEECFSMEPEALKPGFLLLNEIFPFGMCVFVNWVKDGIEESLVMTFVKIYYILIVRSNIR